MLSVIFEILDLKEVVNTWNDVNELPLDLALRTKNDSLANSLLQHDADVNMRDKDGEVLLHKTIRRGDAYSTLFLLDNMCDTSLMSSKSKDTPLHLLASSKHLDRIDVITEKILKSGVNINAQNSGGFTALHVAIQSDNKHIFKTLLEQPGINLNLKTHEEHTPLYYGLLRYEDMHDESDDTYAYLLIKMNVVTNPIYSKQKNDSLLQVIMSLGLEHASMFLISYVENLDHVNEEGYSVLHSACFGNLGILSLKLLEGGANPNLQTYEERQTPLHFCVLKKSVDCLESFNTFNTNIEKCEYIESEIKLIPVDFNLRDSKGDTPLMVAVNKGFIDLIPALIRGKADVNVRNNDDFTLLHRAIMKEDGKTAIFLLENGADVNAV